MKEIAKVWVEKAEEDYRVSKILLSAGEFSSSIAFHAQQCAEKYLKAFLANFDVPPPRTHNLRALNSRCAKIDSEFKRIDESLYFLSPFSTAARYPGIYVGVEEAREAMEHTEKVRDFVREKLGLRDDERD